MNPPNAAGTPYDPTLLQGRTCEHCACFFLSINAEDPTQKQGFCRRAPAELVETRIQVPRLDQNQQPIVKHGQPVMNSERVQGLLFKLAQPNGTCFDGWRPLGSLPGEGPAGMFLRMGAPALEALIQKAGLGPDLAALARTIFQLPEPSPAGPDPGTPTN